MLDLASFNSPFLPLLLHTRDTHTQLSIEIFIVLSVWDREMEEDKEKEGKVLGKKRKKK